MNKWGACWVRGAVVSNTVLHGGGTQAETQELGPYQVRRGGLEAARLGLILAPLLAVFGKMIVPLFVSLSGDIPAI